MATLTVPVAARATVRHLPMTASKIRQVLSLIRGRSAEDAERVLQLCDRSAADPVFKLLESAIANAQDTSEIPPDELYISLCFADEGPTRRTGRPRARGRYGRIHKRSSHVTIELSRFGEDELERIRAREDARGGGAAEQRRRRAERVARSRAADVDDPDTDAADDEVDAAGDAGVDDAPRADVSDDPADADPSDEADSSGADEQRTDEPTDSDAVGKKPTDASADDAGENE